jgi:hypothetical protein
MPTDDNKMSMQAYDSLLALLKKQFPNVSDDNIHYEVDRIYRAFAECESPLEVYDPDAEKAKIEKVNWLLRELEISIDELHPSVFEAIRISTVQMMIKGDSSALDCWNNVQKSPSKLQPHLAAGLSQAEQGVKVRADLNWEAVSVTDACRTIWLRCTGNNPPKTLNPTSPFASFLCDVFELTGVQSDVRSSMNGWRRVTQPKNSNDGA